MLLKFLSLLFSKVLLLFGKISPEKAFERPLSPEEESKCFSQLAVGDKSAEETLVKHNMRLVAHVAQKYKGTATQDELISTGSLGLLKAIKTYNTNKGSSFSTYATRCIDNEILMLLRGNKKYSKQVYLDDAIMSDKDGNEISLADVLFDDNSNIEEGVFNKLAFEKVKKIIEDKLTEREQKVIYMRYGICGYNQFTQIEISQILKISRSYISRIETHALNVIRQNVDAQDFE
ncbi:MAG: sigma-70 family RNA polymerase sigma factor [Clostridia bacterium]|nr:sigma-70 family RNA polymerase sigma factor [Clostridia bacterium]